MSSKSITVDELKKSPDYELLAEVHYSQIKSFIKEEITKGGIIIRLYAYIQLLAIATAGFLGTYHTIRNPRLLWMVLLAVVFSFSLLIVVHEALHALAFLVQGKRNIGFGAQWKKLMFYAESHHHVLNRREMNVVAFTPLVFISAAGLVCAILTKGYPIMLFFILVVLIHLFFCAGDMAIVSYFHRYKSDQLLTYDDKYLKTTFYFRKKITSP